ncbi:hypothetical protein CBFG_05280 [Clostridiales bacterium 1_7_47FAA]|nr:hypothetical protein CBFG_05280 [Clostridiales bacterium 1_7_47FAA]
MNLDGEGTGKMPVLRSRHTGGSVTGQRDCRALVCSGRSKGGTAEYPPFARPDGHMGKGPFYFSGQTSTIKEVWKGKGEKSYEGTGENL